VFTGGTSSYGTRVRAVATETVLNKGDIEFMVGKKEGRAVQAQNEEYSRLWNEARAAAERGDTFFGCTLVETTSQSALAWGGSPRHQTHAPFLGVIEGLGWRLENVDHVNITTVSAGIPGVAGSSGSTATNVVQGYYLFRRALS
jgi:hypothetical protein